jgi:predicted Fe-Mo cluster-binding NifX family protein
MIAENRSFSMAKVAVSSIGPGLDSAVDSRFGRAAGFVIVDTDTMAADFINNDVAQSMGHGAGIQAAEAVARAGVGVVLTGFVGPKAFQALSAAGIDVVQNMGDMTVKAAVERYRSGQATVSQAPNGGRGMGGGRGTGGGRGMGGGGGMGMGGGGMGRGGRMGR